MTRPPDTRPRDDFALASSETPLAPVIRAEMDAAGGRVPFARFMALALGHPEHGYYSAERLAWGRDGDYETSPEVHPVFGYLWARQVEQCWERLGRPGEFHLVEVGAGSGAFAIAILTWLRERAPDCFAATRPTLLDGSPRRLEAQRQALEARGLPSRRVGRVAAKQSGARSRSQVRIAVAKAPDPAPTSTRWNSPGRPRRSQHCSTCRAQR